MQDPFLLPLIMHLYMEGVVEMKWHKILFDRMVACGIRGFVIWEWVPPRDLLVSQHVTFPHLALGET